MIEVYFLSPFTMKNEKLVKEHGDNHHYQQDKKIDMVRVFFKQIGNHTILSN